MEKFIIKTLIFIFLICPSISAENDLDWKKIASSEYNGYEANSNVHNLKPDEKYNTEEVKDYKKDRFNNLITSKRLYTKYDGRNADLNVKSIKYTIESSGSLKGYPVENIFDDSLLTAWAEDDKDYGLGKWIKIKLKCEYENDKPNNYGSFVDVVIFPGYGKTEETFYNNNRLKTALFFVSVSDSNYVDDVPDEKGKYKSSKKNLHVFRLNFDDEPKYHVFGIQYPDLAGKNYEFKLVIEDVYKGNKYNDTCISEVQLVR